MLCAPTGWTEVRIIIKSVWSSNIALLWVIRFLSDLFCPRLLLIDLLSEFLTEFKFTRITSQFFFSRVCSFFAKRSETDIASPRGNELKKRHSNDELILDQRATKIHAQPNRNLREWKKISKMVWLENKRIFLVSLFKSVFLLNFSWK